jgi:hypothetical protein
MDCEIPEFVATTRPKARKDHRCDECGGWIRAGELHDHIVGKWAGEFGTYRTCMDCVALRCEVNRAVGDDDGCGIPLGCLRYSIGDIYDDEQRKRLWAAFIAVRTARGAPVKDATP